MLASPRSKEGKSPKLELPAKRNIPAYDWLLTNMRWFYMLGVTAFLVFLIIIGVVCGLATISVALGMGRGIKVLSTINIWAAVRLLVFVLLAGSTLYTLKGTIESFGVYLASLPQLAFWNDTFADTGWQNSWTVFYWAWTITWSPFVGIFIARISKGRTIRQFVTGVLVVPATFSILWFGIFGMEAINIEMNGGGGLVDRVVGDNDIPGALFAFLEHFPLAGFVSAFSIALVAPFFVIGFFQMYALYRALREDASELPPLRTRRWKKVLPPEEAERRAGDDAEYESQYPEEEIVIDPQIDEEAPEFKDPYVNGDEDELDTSGWPTQPVISS